MAVNNPTTFPTRADRSTIPEPSTGGLLATIGAVSGLGAIAASSCCVLPLALGSLGAGAGAFSSLGALAPWRTPLLIVGGLTLLVAWAIWWREGKVTCASESACAKLGRSYGTLALLTLASLFMVVALGWGYVEPALLRLVQTV